MSTIYEANDKHFDRWLLLKTELDECMNGMDDDIFWSYKDSQQEIIENLESSFFDQYDGCYKDTELNRLLKKSTSEYIRQYLPVRLEAIAKVRVKINIPKTPKLTVNLTPKASPIIKSELDKVPIVAKCTPRCDTVSATVTLTHPPSNTSEVFKPVNDIITLPNHLKHNAALYKIDEIASGIYIKFGFNVNQDHLSFDYETFKYLIYSCDQEKNEVLSYFNCDEEFKEWGYKKFIATLYKEYFTYIYFKNNSSNMIDINVLSRYKYPEYVNIDYIINTQTRDHFDNLQKGIEKIYSETNDEYKDSLNDISDFDKKVQQNVKSEIQSSKQKQQESNKDYDVYDPYYLDNFSEWILKLKGHPFKVGQNGRQIVANELRRVIKAITAMPKQYYTKLNDEEPFNLSKILDKKGYKNWTFGQKYNTKDENGNVVEETKYIHVFDLVDDSFSAGKTQWIPYHKGKPLPNRIKLNPKDEYGQRVFNIFPGFKARKVEPFDDVQRKLIQPLLDHIKEVWCNGKQEYYNYIMSWLAYPIRTLKRSKKALFLIGNEGAGKSLIFDFLSKFVYGDYLCSSIPGFDRIAGKFNGINAGKLLIVVNESAAISTENKSYAAKRGMFEALKTFITDRIMEIEKKGIDSKSYENFANYCGCSNNETSLVIGRNDRRYAIFKCSDIHRGDKQYFDNLTNLCMNEETGNAFYTYLMNEDSFPLVNLDNIPETDIRKELMENSLDPYGQFVEDVFGPEATYDLSQNTLHIVETKGKKGDVKVFIYSRDIFEEYKIWYLKHFNSHPNVNVSAIGRYISNKYTSGETNYLTHTSEKNIGPLRGAGFYLNEDFYDNIRVYYNAFMGEHMIPDKFEPITINNLLMKKGYKTKA